MVLGRPAKLRNLLGVWQDFANNYSLCKRVLNNFKALLKIVELKHLCETN